MAADTATMTGGEAAAATTETAATGATGGAAAAATESAPAPTGAWFEKLPDGLKSEKSLQKFKDEGALAQSYLELEKRMGGSLKIPGKDAKPEEIAAYREKIGVPKSAAEYDLSSLGKEITLDAGQKDAVLGAFHKMGFTQEQVAQL